MTEASRSPTNTDTFWVGLTDSRGLLPLPNRPQPNLKVRFVPGMVAPL